MSHSPERCQDYWCNGDLTYRQLRTGFQVVDDPEFDRFVGFTLKLLELVTRPPLIATVILPVLQEAGRVAETLRGSTSQ